MPLHPGALAFITDGLEDREVMARVFVALGTVRGNLTSAVNMLNVDSRTAAAVDTHDLTIIAVRNAYQHQPCSVPEGLRPFRPGLQPRSIRANSE